jgi:hypothetical protein
MSWIREWGSTADERAAAYPCDARLSGGETLFRAVDVDAPCGLVFAWICQLRAAPYSYDWLDNVGRTSPRARDAANERLGAGHRFMMIFRLVDFRPGEHVTLEWGGIPGLGRGAMTYAVRARPAGSRIVVKIVYAFAAWSPLRLILPAGDLVMMRKQLLTLKRLAENEARHS